VASVLNEHSGIHSQNTGLIGLSNISEDNIDHRHEHSVLLGMSGILDNWDDVGALLSHVD
jgi:predicted xylose isomerase-like sugar epimerase